VADVEPEQVVACFLAEERRATAEVHALSARRAALAQEAMRLNQVLVTVTQSADAVVAEGMRDLWYCATHSRALEAGEPIVWGDVESIVLAGVEAMWSFRQALAPVVEAMAANTRNMGQLLQVTDSEIQQRAELLVAGERTVMAGQASRYPIQ